jgi:hypothetical protein
MNPEEDYTSSTVQGGDGTGVAELEYEGVAVAGVAVAEYDPMDSENSFQQCCTSCTRNYCHR